MTSPLVASHLSKTYKGRAAVDDVSFAGRSGRVLGLLGKNGAGKTTTIKMLLDLVRPERGTAEINGRPYSTTVDAARHVGVALDDMSFLPGATVRFELGVWATTIGWRPRSSRSVDGTFGETHSFSRSLRGGRGGPAATVAGDRATPSDGGQLPTIGGHAPTLVVSVAESDLASGAGYAHADGCAQPVSGSVARHIACGGVIQRIVSRSNGRIVAIGTEERVFNRHQRRAIALRDGGCVIPGCATPAGWCEIHHVTEHARGGPTHTDNGTSC
ncbi:ATP-binding cassette domain-containing protein [Microbacterium lacticum]|uniref:Uncharacterized protein DUF222 n=1 Tax=Microbacterium lacticum TaxID=33885 RepID=A0A4Y3UPK4_9MICO|nr:ATP-binding cassette domain-containing protein [Microbacterium lacticum]TQN00558.1 uncharacterized protein DUF222 [Microbacterium lacticum]GEB96082.1 hypothetical protein MLA01_23010 [Microbacterium lacticum]GGI71738.1 hypothetical protein GCM10009724_23290 [Microbacterium lacticum]